MKPQLLFIALILFYHTGMAHSFKGKILEYSSGKPVAGCKINSNWSHDTIYSAADGTFLLESPDSLERIHIYIGIIKEGYIAKSFGHFISGNKMLETIRFKKNADLLINPMKIDSSLLGNHLSAICKKFKLDQYDYSPIQHIKKVYGIWFKTGDGATLNFLIERGFMMNGSQKRLLRYKVVAIAYFNADCSETKIIGERARPVGTQCY